MYVFIVMYVNNYKLHINLVLFDINIGVQRKVMLLCHIYSFTTKNTLLLLNFVVRVEMTECKIS